MSSMIDFIFSNLFIVIIIVAGLINLFSSNKKEQRKEERRRQLLEERRKRQQEQQQMAEKNEDIDDTPVYVPQQSIEEHMEQETESIEMTGDFEQQRQAQFERLREQIQASSMFGEDEEEIKESTPRVETPTVTGVKKQAPVTGIMKEPLNRKRLMESVIMAEVLGPPRAYKKHRPSYRS